MNVRVPSIRLKLFFFISIFVQRPQSVHTYQRDIPIPHNDGFAIHHCFKQPCSGKSANSQSQGKKLISQISTKRHQLRQNGETVF
ncbi:hypothetical protein T02_6250 [Trichinella nativa]|uniref:Secreted protein n=1 Tax=Trichinella nativa TaxID=6335 RepID=A0A0V1L5Q9_9BILA|nr:hypothetical protein T02_6250 [Trichinella nativa]